MNSNIKPSQLVDRFLSDLGQPTSPDQEETATAHVRERLQLQDWRPAAHLRIVTPVAPSWSMAVWGTIAVAIVLVLAGGLLQMSLLPSPSTDVVAQSIRGDMVTAETRGSMFVNSSRIEAGRTLRAGVSGGAIALLDGSQVEMGPEAELSVVRESQGLRIRLASGTVVVTAAKQRDGHRLYVETRDCLISVVGTVFAVNAEESGSQISVIEGEVRVQRGEISQTLIAGQQASTSPELGPLAQNIGDAWIATSGARLALLQQSTVPAPGPLAEPSPMAAPPPPAQNASGSVVRGRVTSTSGEGIADVTVTLCPSTGGTRVRWLPAPTNPAQDNPAAVVPSPGGPIVRDKTFFFALWDAFPCQGDTVKTDAQGRFEFTNVKPAEYMVTAQREGYLPSPADNVGQPGGIYRYFNAWNGTTAWVAGQQAYTLGFNLNIPLRRNADGAIVAPTVAAAVDARQPVSEISLTLIRANALRGHVRDADGRAVPNAVVRIVSRDGATAATVLTNALGEYAAFGLMPGEYRVAASVANGLANAETWFSRGANPAEASVVALKETEGVSDVDITLPRR